MTALVVVEALAIVMLGILVAGLLRSHAEILRSLHQLGVGLDDGGRFTERKAETTVERALRRCDAELDFRRIECSDVGRGFACRADGRLVATFDEPDPEQPEFSVMC